MRTINKLIIHCSASDAKENDSMEAIKSLHTTPKGQIYHKWAGWPISGPGFSDIGYHFVITYDGMIHDGREIRKMGAHCRGENKNSIGICVTGLDRFSAIQMFSLDNLVKRLCIDFGLHERRDVFPHNHFNKNKTCPNFELPDFYVGSKREKMAELDRG